MVSAITTAARSAAIATLAAVTMALPSISHAAPAAHGGKPILVFESHTGQRPDGIARLMEPLDDELEAHGFAARPATILQVASGPVPRPGILDKDKTAARIAQDVESGYDAFVRGQYRDAITTLSSAIDTIHRNPALVVLDTSNADVTFKAYATLALSQQKLRDAAGSVATMTQVIRMYPTRPLPRSDYGPDDEKFYRDVYKQVQAMGRGRLSIAAGNSQAVIFVDGQIRGIGKASLADLVPGVYRVFLQVPGTAGRQYEVNVAANDDSFLNVESEIDSSLWATDSWIGFQFATDAERGKEARYAGELARRWTGGATVAVVGTMQLQGKPALIGTLYSTDGTMLRSAVVSTDAADEATLRSLARFIAEGTPANGITVIKNAGEDGTRAAATPSGHWWRHPKPFLIGGAATLAVAGAVYLVSPIDDFTKPTFNDYKSPAVAGFVGGSIVVGAGVYLWLRESRSTGQVTAVALGAGVGAILSGAMLYVTDEDPHSDGWQRPTLRDTAKIGVIIGGAGIALAGAGFWLLHREGDGASAPVVTVERGGCLIGWAGSF